MEALEQRVLLSSASLLTPTLATPIPQASLMLGVGASPTTVTMGIVQAGKPSQSPVFQVNVNGSTPTGTVDLYENGTLVGTGTLVNGAVLITAGTPFSAGKHTVLAFYEGDPNNAASYSGSVTFTIAQSPTSTLLTTNLMSIVDGTTVTMNATVSSIGFDATGSVQFYDGNIPLGPPVAINATTGQASLTITLSGGGTHALQAIYLGDTDYASSTSNIVNENVMAITTIRLLALYSPTLSTTANIYSDVVLMNQALLNSEIPAQVVLVDVEEAMQLNADGSVSPYYPTYNYETDLYRLTYNNDGYFYNVPELRSYYQADLVTFISDNVQDNGGSITMGLSWELTSRDGNPTQAFSVVVDPSALSKLPAGYESVTYEDLAVTLAHELGHNLGATHDPINDPSPNTGRPAFIQGRGYRFVGDDGILYHTIMAYSPGTTIPYYSNPNITYQGVPIGSATQNVAAVITQTAPIVANYHNLIPPPKTPVPPQGAMDTLTLNATTVTGYGFDENAGKNAVNVMIAVDGVMSKPFNANQTRQDVASMLGAYGSANHGFSFKLPSNLTTGDHTIQLYVQDAPGSNYVLVDTQTLTVDRRANLSVSVGTPSSAGGSYVPGDWITVPVTITNTGTAPAVGTRDTPIMLNLRMSGNGTYDNSDPLVQQLALTQTLAPGQSVTLQVKFQLDTSVPTGNWYVIAMVDSLDTTNNTAASSSPVPVTWQFGQIPGRKGSVPLTFTDTDGTRVTMKLSGQGTGTLSFLNGQYSLTLTGTTSASTLTITTSKPKNGAGGSGRFTLADLTISGANGIKAIVASTTDMSDAVTIDGAISKLTLGNVTGALTIGQAAAVTLAATVSLGQVNNLVLAAAIPLTSLMVQNWTGGSITGTTLGRLTDKGSLNANILLTGSAAAQTLGSITVTQQITGGTWTIAGNAGTVTAKAATNLNVTLTPNGAAIGNLSSLTLSDATATNSLQFAANALNSLKISGDLLNSTITLSQAVDPKLTALNTLTVGGTMTNSSLRSTGNINSITVGALDHTLLFAGVNDTVTSLPTDETDFVAGDRPTIAQLNIKGISGLYAAPVLTNSSIAAGAITTVKMPNRTSAIKDADLIGHFGFATMGTPVKSYTGPLSDGNYVSGADSQIIVIF